MSERKTIAKSKGKFVKDPPKISLPPTTTSEEDTSTAGQRHINKVWEYTQAIVAVMITGATVYTSIMEIESDRLDNAFFLIVSIYFIRTNHQLIGGTGPKPPPGKQQR